MKKTFLFILLSVFLSIMSLQAQVSQTITVVTAGTLSTQLGDNKTKVTDLTLLGTINDADFQTFKEMTALKNLDIAKVTIVNGAIPNNAFQNRIMSNLVLPASLKTIGNYAFFGMTVSELNFASSPNLEEIGISAFEWIKLTNNTLDFSSNSKLVRFPSTGNNQYGTFRNCSSHVILPLNLKIIPTAAFRTFQGSVKLPEGLETIGDVAFANSNPSKPITFPASLKTIGNGTFFEMTASGLNFASSPNLEEIGSGAFEWIKLTNNTLDFSSNSKLVRFPSTGRDQYGTFRNCSSHVILPLNLKIIPTAAFRTFQGSVKLPEGLETIGDVAFANSNPSKPITFPASLKTIGNGTFFEMTASGLNFASSPNLEEIGSGAFEWIKLTNNTLDFSSNSKLVRFPSTGRDQYGTFRNCSSHVILPLNLKIIPTAAFRTFQGSVKLPEGLETIGDVAFANSNPSKPITFPASLKTIGNGTFFEMTASGLNFASSPNLEEIGSGAFEWIKLTNNTLDFSSNSKLVRFPSTGRDEYGTFRNCSSHVILPLNLKIIPTAAFRYFKGSVKLPEGLETIGDVAFYNAAIKEIHLPSSVSKIGIAVFQYCTQLIKITSCSITPPQMGANVFTGVNKTTAKLEVPKNTLKLYQAADQWRDFTTEESDICPAGPEIPEYTYAPNSYIFDINKKEYGGLLIPVGKAYDVWKNNEFFKTPIPTGKLSASVYWEEVKGLIKTTTIIPNYQVENSNIKVIIDQAKGKGNAVIALHVGPNGNTTDPVYWSWHVWVTDDPTTNGLTLNTTIDGLTNTFMDRNLGATSNSFLGNDWDKSGGLMYQWGRKDPIPPMRYKDTSVPITSTIFGDLDNVIFHYTNTKQYKIKRPFDGINQNIQYSAQNPLKYIESKGNDPVYAAWFAKEPFSSIEGGDYPIHYDLWSDNNKGRSWVPQTFKSQLKSAFDPCPSGWRVPSYSRPQAIPHVTDTPWGNQDEWASRPGSYPYEDFKLPQVQKRHANTKIYPGLGFDFTKGTNPDYNYYIGQYPTTGHFVPYKTLESDQYGHNFVLQDENADGDLWGATLVWGHGRGFLMTSDYYPRPSYPKGWYKLDTFNASTTAGAKAVRCAKDPRFADIPNFETEYIPAEDINYAEGLDNPNSYILVKSTAKQTVSIPVNKAYAVYNQFLTDHQIPSGVLSANVYWTTNKQLIQNVLLSGTAQDAKLEVIVAPNQSGNAVVSLHIGSNRNSNDPVLWSWHIWIPNNALSAVTHTTEKRYSSSGFEYLQYSTSSGLPPLTTEFMDRNLGALEVFPANLGTNSTNSVLLDQARLSGGMQYQWGRKDPIPSFINVGNSSYNIFLGSNVGGSITYTREITGANYRTEFTRDISNNKPSSVMAALNSSAKEPLNFTYRTEKGWLPEAVPALWGHASKKSPFDPCPSGWRIPDHSFNTQSGSPWIKENVRPLSAFSAYEATVFNTNDVKGILFNGSYNIGTLPMTGYRDQYGNVSNSGSEAALWAAGVEMGDDSTGNVYSLSANISNLIMEASKPINPVVAMPVRCAKDLPRLTSNFSAPALRTVTNYVLATEEPIAAQENATLSEANIQISPNPTSGIFKVILKKIPEGIVQIIDINGNQIFSKSFKGDNEFEINIQTKPSGFYIVRVQSGQQVVTKKVIKN